MGITKNGLTDCSDWGCDMHGRDLPRRGVTRRGFMKGGALALVGSSVIPAFLKRSVLAEMTTAAANKKKLVLLFQRGAAAGLNILAPYQEKTYYSTRPSIAIQKKQALVLYWFFVLHTSLFSFSPHYTHC